MSDDDGDDLAGQRRDPPSPIGDDDREPTRISRLLERTVRYHENRARPRGLIRCELWLSSSSSSRRQRRRNDEAIEPGVDGNAVSFWPRDSGVTFSSVTATTTMGASETGEAQTTAPPSDAASGSENERSSSSTTLLGERLANRLLEHHHRRDGDKEGGDSLEWFRFGASRGEDRRWVAPVPFAVPRLGGDDDDTGSEDDTAAEIRGMVCWLFEATPTPTGSSASAEGGGEEDPPPPPVPASVEGFLRSASEHIAATCALESSFRRVLPLPYDDDDDDIDPRGITTARENVTTPLEIHGAGNDEDDDNDSEKDSSESHRRRINASLFLGILRAYFRKYKGCGQKGPQPLCRKQTVFTFVGSFLTIYLIGIFNVYLTTPAPDSDGEDNVDDPFDYSNATDIEIIRHVLNRNPGGSGQDDSVWPPLLMGPFGASVVLIFAMTSGASSQPRSMLAGASIGMLIGILVGYLKVSVGIRMALATALTATLQAITCTIYPPGGALAVIFSSSLLGWANFALQITGTVLAITLGVIFNNLHPDRTYPTFWLGIGEAKKPERNRARIDDGEGTGGGDDDDVSR